MAEEINSMAELMAAYEGDKRPRLKQGEKVTGEILSIGNECAFVDVGASIDGIVELSELMDAERRLTCAVGDKVDLYVVKISDHGIRLSRSVSGQGGKEELENAYRSGLPVEGKVKDEIKGGFQISIMGQRAFCPISQMDSRPVQDPKVFVGQTYRFMITEFKEGGRNIVVSRRRLLDQEAQAGRQSFFETVKPGDTVEGRISKLMPFGAFVELFPGVDGLVHVSELSWAHLEDPAEIFRPGDSVRVKVLGMSEAEKGGTKFSLSIKQVGDDPWQQALPFEVNQKISGKVVRLAKFGAFIELAPGIEGLVHLSEMSYVKRVMRPEEAVTLGESVFVLIKEIDLNSRRISLSMKEAEGDPWAAASEKFKPGSRVEGVVEKKADFGLFINLEPGITGLMPKSEIAKSEKPAEIESLKKGDKLMIVVKELNVTARKVTLTPADAEDSDEWRQFTAEASPAFGSMADKLKLAMEKKKK